MSASTVTLGQSARRVHQPRCRSGSGSLLGTAATRNRRRVAPGRYRRGEFEAVEGQPPMARGLGKLPWILEGGMMKAIVQHEYGAPQDVLKLLEVDTPAVGETEVLVRVRASSANPWDWHFIRG